MIIRKLKQLRTYCSGAKKPFYVTTPIFYVNAAPHIGHLYSAVIADAICRFQRLIEPERLTLLCTGTDENGIKVQQAAAQNQRPVAQYCDEISARYRNVFENADIAYTDYIRTTEMRHREAVSHFWLRLKAADQIYKAHYGGWYCVSDETFLTESQLRLDETSGKRFSLESGHPVEWTEEENYMFRLSTNQEQVLYWLKQGKRVRPQKFEKILYDMLSEPLPDVSISRPKSRVQWAINVPDDDTQTVYVWLDALINYLTSAGYPDEKYKTNWPANVHVIGKDILKFHGIYWPAFLIAAGLEPPQQLFVHSHWTVNDEKMSKSKNNVVDPIEAAKIYTMEGLRYFLLREGVAHSDGNYSATKALRILNSELADTLGNLLSRACAKSLNPQQIYPTLHSAQLNDILLRLDVARHLQETLQQLEERCTRHYEDNNFYLVVDTVMAALHATNNFFETARPWELKSSSGSKAATATAAASTSSSATENTQRLETIIAMTMDALRLCGIVLQPIVPQLSGRLLDKLNVPKHERLWRHLKCSFATVEARSSSSIASGSEITTASHALQANMDAVLFRRILLPEQQSSMQPDAAGVAAKGKQKKNSKETSKTAAKEKNLKKQQKKTTSAP